MLPLQRGVTKDAIRTTLLCSFVQGCVLRALPPELLHNILKAIEWVMLKVVWTTCYALQPLLLSRTALVLMYVRIGEGN